MIELPPGPFDIVLADPAWKYDNAASGASAEDHYEVADLAELAAMGPPVWEACAENAALFMWATGPFLHAATRLVQMWGFRYTTVAFVWVKLGAEVPLGNPAPHREQITRIDDDGEMRSYFPRYGRGNYTRPGAEYCLLGVRGSFTPPVHDVPQVVFAKLGKHSEKPPQVHQRIETMYPKTRRLEMFARRAREGWTAWGKEAPAS